MKPSLPIPRLKRKARTLRREEGIPWHAALDRVAGEQGYRSWSLFMARRPAAGPAAGMLARLDPGDLVLLGGRPGQGKTLISLALAVEAMKAGCRGVFFSLEYTQKDIVERLRVIGADPAQFAELFEFDGSDAIGADYIVATLASAPRGTLVVVDYLQLLDQKRDKPELALQLRVLKSFARERGLILVCLSQIDRSFDLSGKPFPGLDDVRLPNPLDLTLFDKACFVNRGEVRFGAAA